MPEAGWAQARRRHASAPRLAAAVLLHLLLLAALRLAVDRVELARPARERLTMLVDVALHVAPPPPAAPPHALPPPSPAPARVHVPAPALPRAAPPREEAAPTPAPEAQAITAPPPASAPLPARSFLDNAATRQAIRDAARGTLQNRVGEQLAETPGSELVAADGTHVGQVRHVTPTPAQALEGGVAAARKGDCSKGEYVGGGMGLLSLPFLLANEALGKCSPH
jgi:hypothetical protein